MANARMLGGLLLAAGGGLLAWGYQLYGAVGNQLSRALGSGTSNEAMLALAGGVVCLVAGIVVLLRK